MKRYKVTIEYQNINRKNHLITWAENENDAIKFALKAWESTMYKKIYAIEEKEK